MAAFAQNFTITQSSDGLVGTVTDSSNYDVNDEAIAVSDFSARSITILDAYSMPYITLTFEGEDLDRTFDIDDINLWADATMDWTGIAPVANYEKHLQFPLGRITENNYQNVLRLGCCSDAVADNALTIADRYLRGAEIAAPNGNGALWQVCEDSANKYVKQVYAYTSIPAAS